MKRFLVSLLLILFSVSQTWAACSYTSVLNFCQPATGDTGWGANYNTNFATIDALFHATTGHVHTGSGTNGPQLGTGALSFDVATQAELDTHKSSTDHDASYLRLAASNTLTSAGYILLPQIANHSTAKAAPTIAHSGDTDTGLYVLSATNGRMFFTGNGEDMINFGGNGISLDKDYGYAFSSTGAPDGTPDVELMRDGAGLLALRGRTTRGGTDASPAPFAVLPYNFNDTSTPAYERLYVGFSSNTAYVETQKSGTGADDNELILRTGGAASLKFGTDGAAHWQVVHTSHTFGPTADDSYPLGSTSLAPSAIYSFDYNTRGANGSLETGTSRDEAITLSTGGTTTDGAVTVPQYSVLEAVAVYVTTAITGAGVTHFTVTTKNGGTTCNNANVGLTLGSTDKGTACNGTVITNASEKIRITAVGGTPSGGAVRIVIYTKEYTAPTS